MPMLANEWGLPPSSEVAVLDIWREGIAMKRDDRGTGRHLRFTPRCRRPAETLADGAQNVVAPGFAMALE